MIKKEIADGFYILWVQTGRVFSSIDKCSAITATSPTMIRQIMSGKVKSYKGMTFICIDEYGNEVEPQYKYLY